MSTDAAWATPSTGQGCDPTHILLLEPHSLLQDVDATVTFIIERALNAKANSSGVLAVPHVGWQRAVLRVTV